MIKTIQRSLVNKRGMTMVELMITAVVFGVILAVLNSLFFSSHTMYVKTNQRAGMQMTGRMGMSIMTTEILLAGCDPTGMGVVGVVRATADSIRVRADADGDGAISTAEPSEDVIYFFDAASQSLNRDPGTGPSVIVPNVSNATFAFLDGANNTLGPLPLSANLADRVRTVAVTITTTSADVGNMTLTTSIAIRNP